jgi:hypothetical protein
LHKRVRGSYAVVAQVAGYGLLAFRDPYGIRPLCIGFNDTEKGPEYLIASESVALEGLGFHFLRDVLPGEAIFIDNDGKLYNQQCAESPTLNPCAFEFVYLARPDSVIDGASVYAARLKMGEYLAHKIRREFAAGDIDVVMPIPDSSRPSAMELAMTLNLDYREGFIKNRYIGRTFLMPGQAIRRKSVRQKLNAISAEFKGKSVLLVDDSIVRALCNRQDARLTIRMFGLSFTSERVRVDFLLNVLHPEFFDRNGTDDAQVISGWHQEYWYRAAHDDGVQYRFMAVAIYNDDIARCHGGVPDHLVRGRGSVGDKVAVVCIENPCSITFAGGYGSGMVE